MDLSQVNDKLYHIILHTSPWSRIGLRAIVVIGSDCIGSCKSKLIYDLDQENPCNIEYYLSFKVLLKESSHLIFQNVFSEEINTFLKIAVSFPHRLREFDHSIRYKLLVWTSLPNFPWFSNDNQVVCPGIIISLLICVKYVHIVELFLVRNIHVIFARLPIINHISPNVVYASMTVCRLFKMINVR